MFACILLAAWAVCACALPFLHETEPGEAGDSSPAPGKPDAEIPAA